MELQKAPLAVLGALGLKVLGRNPPEFADALVGVVDLYDQYLCNEQLKTYQNFTSPVTLGLNLYTDTFTVPNGKLWRVLVAGGYFVLNTADVGLIAQGLVNVVSPISSIAGTPLLHAFNLPQSGTFARNYGTHFPRPICLPSGWGIRCAVQLSGNTTVVAGSAQGSQILVHEIDL